jgi:hypothetical protein
VGGTLDGLVSHGGEFDDFGSQGGGRASLGALGCGGCCGGYYVGCHLGSSFGGGGRWGYWMVVRLSWAVGDAGDAG